MKNTIPNRVTAAVLIHHSYIQDPYTMGTPYGESKAVHDALLFLVRNGLLEDLADWSKFKITEKGLVLVDHWMGTQLPELIQTWVIPE
jgi:hypothetical protein